MSRYCIWGTGGRVRLRYERRRNSGRIFGRDSSGGRRQTILHLAYPGGIPTTPCKCLDALWQFYQRTMPCASRIYTRALSGVPIRKTVLDERLDNRFDYDGDAATVLNRFLMQAAMNVPLTVYGTGGQTRAFIHGSDTARCIDTPFAIHRRW
jgi:UDP-sulfoquinovose synthase